MMWIIELYEDGYWKKYGQPSSDFTKLYGMCRKFAENGQKARVIRYKE
jgi:hypothetical protein